MGTLESSNASPIGHHADIAIPERFPDGADVAGKRVVLTGASRGLGRVLAHAFDRAGAHVALVARTQHDVESTRSELGGEHLALTADIAREDDNERIISEVTDSWGGVDVWIANAGISPSYCDLTTLKPDTWREIIEVNLTGVFLGVTAAGRVMQNGGRIIVTGSVLGERPMRGLGAYSVSKAAIGGLIKTLALELGEAGITVNAVAPGWFDSPMARPFQESDGRAQSILDHTALGRWGRSADLAGPYLFLASDSSSFVTGSVLPLDGGYLLV